jgi:hypothetical protein
MFVKLIDGEEGLTISETPGGQRRYYASEVRAIMQRDDQQAGDEQDDEQPTKLKVKHRVQEDQQELFLSSQSELYRVVSGEGKTLPFENWINSPTESDLENAYGAGVYRVFKLEAGNKLVKSAKQYNISSAGTSPASADKGNSSLAEATATLMSLSKLGEQLKGGSNRNDEFLMQMLSEQNKLFLTLLLERRNEPQRVGGGMTEFMQGLEFARSLGTQDGETAATERIFEIVQNVAAQVIPMIAGGPRPPADVESEALDLSDDLPALQPVQLKTPATPGEVKKVTIGKVD